MGKNMVRAHSDEEQPRRPVRSPMMSGPSEVAVNLESQRLV